MSDRFSVLAAAAPCDLSIEALTELNQLLGAQVDTLRARRRVVVAEIARRHGALPADGVTATIDLGDASASAL